MSSKKAPSIYYSLNIVIVAFSMIYFSAVMKSLKETFLRLIRNRLVKTKALGSVEQSYTHWDKIRHNDALQFIPL